MTDQPPPQPAPEPSGHPPDECGQAGEATAPGHRHYQRHYRKRETPCPKSRAETAWAAAEEQAGRPLPDYPQNYQQRNTHYECGGADEATEPGTGHYQRHYRKGETPCPKSLAEKGHYDASRQGRADGYEYGRRQGNRRTGQRRNPQ